LSKYRINLADINKIEYPTNIHLAKYEIIANASDNNGNFEVNLFLNWLAIVGLKESIKEEMARSKTAKKK